jgi:hypothetical protein
VSKGLIDSDVAIALVDYNPETECGRHVVFVRDQSNQKAIKQYLIDPAMWVDQSLHVRQDISALQPAWYIGVHPMKQSSKAGK